MSSILYCHPVSYIEVTFTIPHIRENRATIGNLIREVQKVVAPVGAIVDANYSKEFRYIHFSLEFAEKEEFDQIAGALEAWAIEHKAIG